jgi:hypothetical protein
MGPDGVVLAHPGIDRGLGRGQVRERVGVVQQLPAQRLVEAFHLAGGRGRGGPGEPMGDGVVAADAIKQHLPTPTKAGGELLAVVGEDLLGHPEPPQRARERQAHRPPRGPSRDLRDDAVAGVVIDPGDDLGLGAVGQPGSIDDVQLPQRHRRRALPAPVVLPPSAARARDDEAVADQDPVDRHPRRHARPASAAAQLVLEPAWAPAGMLPAQLTDGGLQLCRDLVGAGVGPFGPVNQSPQPSLPIAGQPRVQRLSGDPDLPGDLADCGAGLHGQDGAIALLDDTQLHQGQSSASCPATTATDARQPSRTRSPVNHVVKPRCQASTGTGQRPGRSSCEDFLYTLKRRLRAAAARPSSPPSTGAHG